MDDLILPLALAFAVTVLTHFVVAAILALPREWARRKTARAFWRGAES